MDCRRIFGTAPEDRPLFASFFESTHSHHHVCLAVVAISSIVVAAEWGCIIWTQFKSIFLDCTWVANYLQLSHNPLDSEKRDLRLCQDCKKIEMLLSIIAGHCGTIADTHAIVLACPTFRAQTWPPAVRLGLIEDCSPIAPFFADCQQIGTILSGLQKNTFGKSDSRSGGLWQDWTFFCNRDW